MKALSIAFGFILLGALPVSSQTIGQGELQAIIDETHAEFELVALGAAIAQLDEPVVVAVAGRTRKGGQTPVQPENAWHIGSNTKALTALLYGRLVEDGRAQWGASVADLFSGSVEAIDPAWNDVVIEDLFAHRAGVGQLGPAWLIARHADARPVQEQRLATVEKLLQAPPRKPVGEFEYSNLNYIVAGAALEQIVGTSWETAMDDHVFSPGGQIGPDGWGVGAPPSGPEGHKRNLFGFKQAVGRGAGADNPPALGPAGTLHAPLASHARLLLEFIDPDSALITPGMRARLLEPWPDETANYAMGWGIADDPVAGKIYAHAGSNTFWLSRAVLVPEHGAVIVVNTNEFSNASRAATDAVIASVSERLAGEEQ